MGSHFKSLENKDDEDRPSHQVILCFIHGIVYKPYAICTICYLISINQINGRYLQRHGDDLADPLVDLEEDDVGNGQIAPRILEEIIDVENYLSDNPTERTRLGVPDNYSSCAPPWIDTPVLRLQIPIQRPIYMPPPTIPTPSPSPPSSPALRRIYTLRPENEEVTQRTTPRHLTIDGRHDPASGQVALFNFPALRDAAPPTREPEEEEGLTEQQLHNLLQERRNLQRAARQARSEVSSLEPETRRLRNLLERQDQQLAEQLEALTLEARRPTTGFREYFG